MVNILKYVYGADKGGAKAGEAFASPLAYQGMDIEYSSEAITGEEHIADSANMVFYGHGDNANFDWVPVVPQSAVFYVNGTAVTPTYDATADSYTLTNSVSDVITIDYRYNNTYSPAQVPTIGLKIDSVPIKTVSRKLAAMWAWDAKLVA